MAARAQTRVNLTDRAKRYRAQNAVEGPRVCCICGAKGPDAHLGVMHLTGNEDHGEKENLAYGCKSCNGKLAAAFKTLGLGRPTNQYNPAKKIPPTFEQYSWAVASGERDYYPNSTRHAKGVHDEAGAIIHRTPKHLRIEYAKRIARAAGKTKKAAFADRWNPAGRSTMAEWIADFKRQGREVGLKDRKSEFPTFRDGNEMRRQAEYMADTAVNYYNVPASKKSALVSAFTSAYSKAWRRNPAGASSELYEEFHGRPSAELVTVKKRVHRHEHLASLGVLKLLVVDGLDGKRHNIGGFGKNCLLCSSETKDQLFVEGGDQAIDVREFGIKAAHEREVLGALFSVEYHTTKDHLGDEGGTANYVHEFCTTNKGGRHVRVPGAKYPTLIYDRVNEVLLISGGSYIIRREGIDL